jgi:hypothetical protein
MGQAISAVSACDLRREKIDSERWLYMVIGGGRDRSLTAVLLKEARTFSARIRHSEDEISESIYGDVARIVGGGGEWRGEPRTVKTQ